MEYPINVLIVDDIPVMRSLLKKVLRDCGYNNVTEAANGEVAIEKFKVHNYSMVMLDINMPIKDGVTVLKEIREINPDVFVVMVSADSTIDNIKSTLALGVNGFIVKPYTMAKISGVIQKFNLHLQKQGITPSRPS